MPPVQANRPTMLEVEVAPTLPVYSADGMWRSSAQQANLPAVAVQGITVVDDFAKEAVQPALQAQSCQEFQVQQNKQRAAAKRDQPAAKHQPAGGLTVSQPLGIRC